MNRIHLVYPHGSSISCPDAIGRNLGEHLKTRGYEVTYYNWDDTRVIQPQREDVLLGHPHPFPWTCFRRSARRKGWRRVIALSPYNHDEKQVAFFDADIHLCDLYLAITGNYWFGSVKGSPFSHWLPKMVHVDLAVDRTDFPVIKRGFNPPGLRRFLYIGHSSWQKNPGYLSEIARSMPETGISWVGSGRQPIPGLTPLGFQDFRTQRAKDMVASHDFLVTVGKADANPTTILEAMAWGLIPVCTPQSGYEGYAGIVNVPLGNSRKAVAILSELQLLPESRLLEMQAANWNALDTHFNWDRFVGQVIAAIESDASPPIQGQDWTSRLMVRWSNLRSPYSPLRPSRANLKLAVRAFRH